mmetsp:Transcript_118238/g.297350  ORF Transcript_118238/g.297350 Transcript_118238/m.297350 type:complete len:170 (-) Transcript_118238:2-511(-)
MHSKATQKRPGAQRQTRILWPGRRPRGSPGWFPLPPLPPPSGEEKGVSAGVAGRGAAASLSWHVTSLQPSLGLLEEARLADAAAEPDRVVEPPALPPLSALTALTLTSHFRRWAPKQTVLEEGTTGKACAEPECCKPLPAVLAMEAIGAVRLRQAEGRPSQAWDGAKAN